MSTARFFGILFFSISLHAQIPIFPSRIPPSAYTGFLRTASGDGSVVDDFPKFTSDRAPISGVVSLHELQHPIPRKAMRDAYAAQKLARANRVPEAIAKLEDAIRIAPEYRDAYVNLGVQYAQVGRTADARAQLEKALSIGPPLPVIYYDLAVASLTLNQPLDAETFARKALDLDPADAGARRLLEFILRPKENAAK